MPIPPAGAIVGAMHAPTANDAGHHTHPQHEAGTIVGQVGQKSEHQKHSSPEYSKRTPKPGQAGTKFGVTSSMGTMSMRSSTSMGLSYGRRLARRFIRNQVFEVVMAVIILFNFVMIIIEANATAERGDRVIPDPPLWIEIGGWVALGVFVIELILRLYVERMEFFRDSWNTFDFFVITVDTICSVLGVIFGNAFPVSALRILRLAKLARVTKIFRVFPELRLMMAGLIGCMRSIFWGMVLLLFTLVVWAVIGVQFIHPLNLEMAESGLYQRVQCDRCPKAYETVQRAALTLLRESVAGDGWGYMTVPLIEEYPGAALYFLGVMMSISMALLNLILGVVVNVAMQARDDLIAQMEAEKVTQRVDASGHLELLCIAMDADESGQLSKEELFTGYQEQEEFRNTLNELGIAEDDLEILWTVLDPERDGQVPFSVFINKSFSMKESDTQFMLAYIKYYVTKIRDRVMQGQDQIKEYMMGFQERLRRLSTTDNNETVSLYSEFQEVLEPEAEKQHVSLGGPRPAAHAPSPNISDARSCLSVDDLRVLDDMLTKLRQWRDELGTSIDGANASIDSVGKDAVWTKFPQPILGRSATTKKKDLWCCNDASSQSAMESIVGQSEQSAENVVHVTEDRLQSSRSRNSRVPRPQATEMIEGQKSSSLFGRLV